MNKRSQLAHVLRTYACDLSVAGPQYASMAGVLNEAADELDPPSCGVADPPVPVVIDGDDGLPRLGGQCPNCED